MSLPPKSKIVEYWHEFGEKQHLNGKFDELPRFVIRLVTDVGEPFCWGCHCYSKSWDFAKREKKPKRKAFRNLYLNWNRLPLERCHILPKGKNGTDFPSNLVLLCHKCHLESPDVTNPEYMITWLNKRQDTIVSEGIKNWKIACECLNQPVYETWDKYELLMLYHKEDFEQFCFEHSVPHFNQYVNSTLISCIVEFFKINNLDWNKMLNAHKQVLKTRRQSLANEYVSDTENQTPTYQGQRIAPRGNSFQKP